MGESSGIAPDGGRPQAPVRVFIVEAQDFVRQGLRGLLEAEGLDVIGECGTAREANNRIIEAGTDVAVLTGILPDGTGIEVCRDARSVDPALKCLILTSYADDEALQGIVLAGAAGYVLRQLRNQQLAEAIRHAASGNTLLGPDVLDGARIELIKAAGDPRFDAPTHIETQVLALITQGQNNRQIGESLGLGERTVRDHISALLAKLGLGGKARPRART